jgi:hypothetical protein
MFARTSIGGLLLEDVAGWRFVIQDGVIAAKFPKDEGILRIKTIASNRMPHPVTHDACLAQAAQLAEAGDPKPANWIRSQAITGPYGSANFDRGADRVYVWYCCRSPGVIIGTYSCTIDLSHTSANRGLRAQCSCMISTAIFDRRIWGADDEITRLLTTLLAKNDAPPDSPRNIQK